MNIEIMIPSDEPVRLLSAVLEELDYRKLAATYSRIGREDMQFRRFLTRGHRNITVECNLLSTAYNIMKLHHRGQSGRLGCHLFVTKHMKTS